MSERDAVQFAPVGETVQSCRREASLERRLCSGTGRRGTRGQGRLAGRLAERPLGPRQCSALPPNGGYEPGRPQTAACSQDATA